MEAWSSVTRVLVICVMCSSAQAFSDSAQRSKADSDGFILQPVNRYYGSQAQQIEQFVLQPPPTPEPVTSKPIAPEKAGFSFDVTKADVVFANSLSTTTVPRSANPFGQVIFINKGNSLIENVGTNLHTLVVNQGYDGPVQVKLSPDSTDENQLEIDDQARTLQWTHHATPLTHPFAGVTASIQEAGEEAIIERLASLVGLSKDKADAVLENRTGSRLSVPPSINPYGQYIEVSNGGVEVKNVGSNPNTYFVNRAKNGPVALQLTKFRPSNYRLVVYNGGSLMPVQQAVSFLELSEADNAKQSPQYLESKQVGVEKRSTNFGYKRTALAS